MNARVIEAGQIKNGMIINLRGDKFEPVQSIREYSDDFGRVFEVKLASYTYRVREGDEIYAQ
jgi:hypothetical protein